MLYFKDTDPYYASTASRLFGALVVRNRELDTRNNHDCRAVIALVTGIAARCVI